MIGMLLLLIVLVWLPVLILGRLGSGWPAGTRREPGEEIGPPQERIARSEQEVPWWHPRYAEDFELWERER